MKKNMMALSLAIAWTGSVMAGTVAGFGGATEFTQIANNVQLGASYAKQIQQYTAQALQLQAELKNLTSNPLSLLGPEVGKVINGVGQIMSAGNSIGGNMARIDSNFANTFKNPQAFSMSQNFTRWHSTSTDTLQGAMKAAGLHRDNYQSDSDALTALYNQSQATEGNLQAAQTLAKINTMQVQQLQKLGDLMATQNIATATYMASQTAKDEAQNNQRMLMGAPYVPEYKQTQTETIINWKSKILNK
jgi:type IV secretion system protein TrbJ